MPKSVTEADGLICIGVFAAELQRLHLRGTDEDIDREFNAVCRKIWAYTLDDFDDESLSKADHSWLDGLTASRACRFAAENGYDLATDSKVVSDWWGFSWMILAEKRGLLTPEQRFLAWKKHDERMLAQQDSVRGYSDGRD